ncbi:MAG: UdgX family uracil-DNA binding protein, partial [Deltaproteobacteria bacterium]|nr:UdgX family uracil-DNA binding protein [Deltaproteobacteria bacterium]
LAYRVLWRLAHGEPALLDNAADVDVRALVLRAKAVTRDLHKMHAFVRFRQVDDETFVAWHAPDHFILERAAMFFVDRFASMRWAILTPDKSAHWDGEQLTFSAGVPRSQAPAADAYEEMWRTYYASIFNPARANPKVMRQHMPSRFWPTMPESALVPELLARAAGRVETMLDAHVPAERSLPVLRAAAAGCAACELCGPATQTVFGEGPEDARLVLVGEQPGDQEDLAGRPFVGPAGEVLDAALAAAGIERGGVYLTNAVKHFRFLPRGKKRLHQRPTADQVRACKPWLAAELQMVQPRVVVCLGATAAQSLIGSRFKITQERGREVQTKWAAHLLATHHPAAILRVDPADRGRYEAELVADLQRARALLAVP